MSRLVPIVVELHAAMENVADLIDESREMRSGYQTAELTAAFVLLSQCAVGVALCQPNVARMAWRAVPAELCELYTGRLTRFLAYLKTAH